MLSVCSGNQMLIKGKHPIKYSCVHWESDVHKIIRLTAYKLLSVCTWNEMFIVSNLLL